MAKKKKKQKKYTNAQKQKYYQQKQLRQAMIGSPGMPFRFALKHKYVEDITLNPPAGGLNTYYVFRASSVYDPNETGAGHQTRFFDEIMPMYNHWVVVSSTIRVTFQQRSGETNNIKVGVALKGSNTPLSDPNDYMESTYQKYRLLGHAGSSKDGTTLTYRYNAKQFHGISNIFGPAVMKGNVGANATENAFYHVWACGQGGSDPGNIDCNVQITYLTMFLEPKMPSQS